MDPQLPCSEDTSEGQSKAPAQGQESEEDSFSLLKNLPPEICNRVIFPFLDGKALSTLHLALIVDKSEKASECGYSIQKSGNDRLEFLCQSWRTSLQELTARYASVTNNGGRDILSQIRVYILRALTCINRFQRDGINQDDARCQIRRISESGIMEDVFSFPYDTLGIPAQLLPGHRRNLTLEWPIWCGRIKVLIWVPRGSFHGFKRIILEANVVLLSPCWDPGWDLGRTCSDNNDTTDEASSQSIDTIQLVTELYNFLPRPPLGRLVGMREKDQETLKTLSTRLSDQNTVAIISPQHHARLARTRYIDNIRIISRSQARERLRIMPSLPFSFYVEGDDAGAPSGAVDLDSSSDLLCCWQYHDLFDDTVFNTAREYVPYWKRLVQVRNRCLEGS